MQKLGLGRLGIAFLSVAGVLVGVGMMATGIATAIIGAPTGAAIPVGVVWAALGAGILGGGFYGLNNLHALDEGDKEMRAGKSAKKQVKDIEKGDHDMSRVVPRACSQSKAIPIGYGMSAPGTRRKVTPSSSSRAVHSAKSTFSPGR